MEKMWTKKFWAIFWGQKGHLFRISWNTFWFKYFWNLMEHNLDKICGQNFFQSKLMSGQICYLFWGGGGGAGDGGGVPREGGLGSKNQSCSERPETHCFGIFEIWLNFQNFASGHKQANKQPYTLMHRHHSDHISRPTRWGTATKKRLPAWLDEAYRPQQSWERGTPCPVCEGWVLPF